MSSVEVSGAGTVAAQPAGQVVEVAGTLRVRQPLTAEFSGKPCAYFKAEIEREEVYYERDSQGREERRTRTTTVYTNTKYGQCLVEDTSGKVGIDFDGADVEAVQTVKEPCPPPGQAQASGMIDGRAVRARQFQFDLHPQGKHSRSRHSGVRARRGAAGRADRQAGEGLEEQDLRHQPQIEGRAHDVAHQEGALAAHLHRAVARRRGRPAGVVGGEGGREENLRPHPEERAKRASRRMAACTDRGPSFETAAARPPQDEAASRSPLERAAETFSAASSVASRLAKQKRTTERIGSLA